MLNFGNKEFRNLQEQVLKNMQDIQDIEQGATVLADFGIKVVGQVDSTDDLPDPAEYEGEYGDAYLVGTEKPYNYYIFTRAFEGQEEPSWFDLGEFPVPGPQGAQGPQGETGATPVIGATVGSVSTLNPGQSATASVSVSGTAAQPTMTFNFAIPQGAQGIQGATGPQGPQGPRGLQGEKGEKGEQGGLIDIVGIVATADLLPAPSTLQKLDAAYLVGTSPDYELYVQVGETPSTALWTNLGAVNEGTVVTVNGTPQTVWEANGKVSVSDGYLMNTLYGQAAGTGNGQTHVPYGTAATANYIPQRDANGQILVPETPTANNQAASKAYVDANAGGQSPIEYAGDLIVGNSSGEESRLAIGSAGQVLTVNSGANGLEYTSINSVPSYTNTDASKSLKVNSSGTGLEWASAGGSLPLKSLNNLSIVAGCTTTVNDEAIESSTLSNVSYSLILNNSTKLYLPSAITNSLILTGSAYNYNTSKKQSLTNSVTLNTAGTLNSNGYGYVNNSFYALSNAPTVNSNKEYTIKNSVVCLFSGIALSSANKLIFNRSLITGDTHTLTGYSSSTDFALNEWVLGGQNHTVKCPSANMTENNATYAGRAILGQYGIWDGTDSASNTDMFMVGAGTATTKANCFATGNDGTNDYIKIGDTKITEAQLQSLLALL